MSDDPVEYQIGRLANARHPYQRQYKCVLCVCTAGLLRSPTVAWVLGQEPWNYNTRAAGVDPTCALIVVDNQLLTWADEIVCVELRHRWALPKDLDGRPVYVLDIPDHYAYRDPRLVALIKQRYTAFTEGEPSL